MFQEVKLPYKSIADLPGSVKDALPQHAQEIFLKAFNATWDKYHQEERAFAVAWGAVKRTYSKDEKTGRWRRKKKTEP